MAKFEVIKAVRIDGTVYSSPKFAAERWVKVKMREATFKYHADKGRSERAWHRMCNTRLRKRYSRMAEPYFAKLLS